MFRLSHAVCSLVFPCVLWSCGGSQPTIAQTQLSEQTSNQNALRFIQIPTDSETIALQLWMPFGSQDESAGQEGAAMAAVYRLLELAKPHGLNAQLEALGVAVNSYVTFDTVAIELECLPNELDDALQLLDQALTSPDWSEDGWGATLNLIHQQATAHLHPRRNGLESLLAEVFPGDPMAHTPLPTADAIDQLEPAQLTTFARSHIVPEGALIVAAGPIQPNQLDGFLKQWRGRAKKRAPATTNGFRYKSAQGPYVALERAPLEWATLRWGFPFGELTPEQAATLDLLALILTEGAESRIQHTAALHGLNLQNLRSFATAPHNKGLFVVELDCASEDIDALFQMVTTALYGFPEKPTSQQEIDRARHLLRENKQHTLAQVTTKARRTGRFSLRWPQLDAETRYENALLNADARVLAETAQKLFDVHQTIAQLHVPQTKTDIDLDSWGETLTETLREIAQSQLDARDDFELLLTPHVSAKIYPQKGIDSVGISVVISTGYSSEPLEDGGISELLAQRLAGDDLEAQVYRDHITLQALTTQDQADELLATLAQRLTDASWEPDVLETARFQVSQLRQRQGILDDARHALERQIYHLPKRIDRLEEFTPAEVRAWYEAHIAHAPLAFTIVGNLSPKRVAQALQTLNSTRHGIANSEIHNAELPETNSHLRAIDGETAHLFWGYPVDLKSEDDIAKLEVLAELICHNPDALQQFQKAIGGEDMCIEPLLDLSPQGYLALHLEAPAQQMPALQKALEIWISKLRSLPTGIADLRAARRKVASHRTIEWNNPAKRAQFYAEHQFRGRTFARRDGAELWRNAIHRVTPRDLSDFASKACSTSNRIELWIAPISQPESEPLEPQPKSPIPLSQNNLRRRSHELVASEH